MITEDQLEQLALTWFQDAGWDYRHGPDIAPNSDLHAARSMAIRECP